jgi:hypothetical protein
MTPACFRWKPLELDAVPADDQGMDDLTSYRLDEADKRAERTESRFDRIDAALLDIKLELSALKGSTATRGTVWGALATSVGAGLGLLGVIVAILTYLQAFPRPH